MPCGRSVSTRFSPSFPQAFSRYWLVCAAWMTLALASCLVPVAAHAQYRASIQGTVTDQQGAVIPGATLSLTDASTSRTLTTKTDAHGNYFFNALPADTFILTVNGQGFSTKTLNGVTLIPEQPNTINVKLEVGATSEAVNVNAAEGACA
jgi:hypothetical protein